VSHSGGVAQPTCAESRFPEQKPRLPWLEYGAGAPGHDGGLREAPAEQQQGREHRAGDPSARQRTGKRAAHRHRGQDDRHGDQGPRLVGHRQADQHAGQDRPRPRGQHRGHAQRAAQELLRVPDLERRQRGGAGGEGAEHDDAIEP
jgi:hypothetical protein